MLTREKIYALVSGIVAFSLVLLLISVAFVTDDNLGNRTAKIFWFYKIIPVIGIACIPLVWIRPFRFTVTDGLLLIYTLYVILNFHYTGSQATTRVGLLILVAVTYFLFRCLTTFAPSHWANSALLLAGAIEAIRGLAQLYGFSPSLHSHFELTGSFFNPGPYSGFLATILPLSLYYGLSATRTFRILSSITFILLVLVLPATMSRGAWLAALVGGFIVLGYHYRFGQHLQSFYRKHRKITLFISGSTLFMVIFLLIGSYLLKKNSADGRLLIWKVSASLVAEHPLIGVGFGNFAGPYGEAQAVYFSSGKSSSQEEMVADAPEFAFNEFVQIATETGVPGLLLFLAIIYSAIRLMYRSGLRKQSGLLGSLAAFLVFSCFSYPFSMLPLVIIFTLLLAQSSAFSCTNSPRWITGCSGLLLLIPLFLVVSRANERERAFKKWKNEQIYFNMQVFERTVDNYRKLYPLLKDQPAFLFEYGQCLSRTNQPEESNRILEVAAQLSADPMIHNIIGKNYQTLQQYSLAEAAYLKATRMVPNRLYPLYRLAKMYEESGQTEKAITTARLVLEKIPKITSPATEEMKRDMHLLLRGS